ncbi:hypothetical protein Tco_0940753 [Tanacetum coccineum]|uniref:Reverse transcriptase Ty1/copia-type domain-containing protein n=1 Tax=Tanacetum coccineum TaxID=301880 RepID=A0ABQ5DRF3_9ASTR
METKDTISLCSDSKKQQMQQIKENANESFMVSFRLLHSRLKDLSNKDLKGTHTEEGNKRIFATLFDQDVQTFTSIMFLNVDQLENQLDKKNFKRLDPWMLLKIEKQNDADADNAEIKPVYEEELIAKDVEKCHEKRPLLDQLTDNKTKELSNQSLKSERQHGQFLKVKSNEAKDQNDIDVIETINIELKHKVAKLVKGNEHLKAQLQEKFRTQIHDHNNEPSSSKLVPEVSPPVDTTDPSLQELEFLFSPMYEEYFNAGNQSVSKSFVLSDNSLQQDTKPTLNVQPILEPIIPPTNVNAEGNNTNQAENAQFKVYEFINPFALPRPEAAESSSHNEELHQFDRLNVWELVDKPFGKTVINLEWLWKNKKDEDNIVIRNKTRLHEMDKCDNIGTPMATKLELDADLSGTPSNKISKPMKKHLKEVKRIFWYIKNTINMGLWYSKDYGFELTAFSDADHTEAKYVALSASYAQVIWMRTQLKDYGFDYNRIPLYYDSQSAIAISCNPV